MKEEVYEIIFKSFNKEDIKDIKEFTYTLIDEEQIKNKTTLFLRIIELQNSLYKEVKESKKLTNPANNLTNLIYLKLYFDAILQIDNDIADFLPVSVLCRMSGKIDDRLNEYIKTMVKINTILEDYIIFMFENLESSNKEYYTIVSNNIINILLEYNDDGTDWNKILEIPKI